MTKPDNETPSSGRTRPRILFVAQHLPVPVRGGSSQRTNLLIEGLRTFADVELVAIGPPGVRKLLEDHGYSVADVLPPEDDGVGGKVTRVLGFLLPGAIRYRPRAAAVAVLRRLWDSGRYDIIVGRYCRPSARSGVHLFPRSIVDIDDVESQKLSSWIAQQPLARLLKAPTWIVMRRMQAAERSVIGALARAWLSAADDLGDLPSDRIDVIPNIPFYPAAALGPSPSDGTILFVASLDYRVNVDALNRLVDVVWPRVRAAAPDLRLRVVGGGLDAASQARLASQPGVDYAGFVDDLTAEYAGAMCSVVPIWEGGGTKIKILESLALGRTCVVAAPSMRGYSDHLRDDEDVIVANDEDAFVTGILTLAADQPLRHRLEMHARNAVNAHFSREMLAKRLRASVEHVTAASR